MSTEFEIVGIGVGPANLAVLTAILDLNASVRRPTAFVFLERSSDFSWLHSRSGRERLQVPYLKDLAMQRDPRSRFTFLNFLHEAGRLEAFINLRDHYPTLGEFADYLSWVAEIAGDHIRYRHHVMAIEPVITEGDRVQRLRVVSRTGAGRVEYLAKTVVVATGRNPHIPSYVSTPLGNRIFHTSGHLTAPQPSVYHSSSPQILVIGSGQSAIEAALENLQKPGCLVQICLRGASPLALDDNPFVNSWYQSPGVSNFRLSPTVAKREILRDIDRTNRGVSDRSLLDELYRQHYYGLRHGVERVSILARREPVQIVETSSGVLCTLRNLDTGLSEQRHVDAVVLATGYSPPDFGILDPVKPWMKFSAIDEPLMNSDRQLETLSGFKPRIFVNGHIDEVFGPADSTLSNLACRGGELARAICGAAFE